MKQYQSVKEYLASLQPKERKLLKELQSWIKELLPGTEECISYGMPTYKVNGKSVVGFACHKNHFSFYPYSGKTLEAFPKEKAFYGGTKSGLHFTYDKPLTKTLVKKIIQAKLKELSL